MCILLLWLVGLKKGCVFKVWVALLNLIHPSQKKKICRSLNNFKGSPDFMTPPHPRLFVPEKCPYMLGLSRTLLIKFVNITKCCSRQSTEESRNCSFVEYIEKLQEKDQSGSEQGHTQEIWFQNEFWF